MSTAPIKILTSKQWVLPPRPKPGRKPSLDTPTTKRKAQNRAAQRAFRERKANKIQELEQSLGALKTERNRIEIALTSAQNDNALLNKSLQAMAAEKKSLVIRCNQLAEQVRSRQCVTCRTQGRSPLSDQLDVILNLSAKITYLESALEEKNAYIRQLQSSYTPSLQNSSSNNNNTTSPASASSLPTPSEHASPFEPDCNACDKDECICETIGIKTRKPDIVPVVPLRRPLESEIDFTEQFSSSAPSKQEKLTRLLKTRKTETSSLDIFSNNELFRLIVSKDTVVEPCGFCLDDLPCVCREASKEQSERRGLIKLPPLSSASPLSESWSPLETLKQVAKSGCTGNPGTCLQCQSDPMSTLFCTTIASKVSDERSRPNGRSEPKAAPKPNLKRSSTGSLTTLPAITGNLDTSLSMDLSPSSFSSSSAIKTFNGKQLFIPCLDAYKTLSRHDSFHKMDFNTLVAKLNTKGMQVEVQSVVNVLREMDEKKD